jgi:hypothetical protein
MKHSGFRLGRGLVCRAVWTERRQRSLSLTDSVLTQSIEGRNTVEPPKAMMTP